MPWYRHIDVGVLYGTETNQTLQIDLIGLIIMGLVYISSDFAYLSNWRIASHSDLHFST